MYAGGVRHLGNILGSCWIYICMLVECAILGTYWDLVGYIYVRWWSAPSWEHTGILLDIYMYAGGVRHLGNILGSCRIYICMLVECAILGTYWDLVGYIYVCWWSVPSWEHTGILLDIYMYAGGVRHLGNILGSCWIYICMLVECAILGTYWDLVGYIHAWWSAPSWEHTGILLDIYICMLVECAILGTYWDLVGYIHAWWSAPSWEHTGILLDIYMYAGGVRHLGNILGSCWIYTCLVECAILETYWDLVGYIYVRWWSAPSWEHTGILLDIYVCWWSAPSWEHTGILFDIYMYAGGVRHLGNILGSCWIYMYAGRVHHLGNIGGSCWIYIYAGGVRHLGNILGSCWIYMYDG